MEELKLTDLAQRAKIEELTSSESLKSTLVSQLQDNINVLNDTIKGIASSSLLLIALLLTCSIRTNRKSE